MRRAHGTRIGRWIGLAAMSLAALLAAAGEAGAQQWSFEEVIANLKVGDPKVRMEALRLLRQAGYLEAAPAVAPLLSDPVPEIQHLAIETALALYLVDEAYVSEFGQAVVRQKGASLPLLAFAVGRGATIANTPPLAIVRGFAAGLISPVARTKFDSAYALGVVGAPLVRKGQFPEGRATCERLLAFVRDPDANIRLAGTHVLGRLLGAAVEHPEGNTEMLALKNDVGDQLIAGMNDSDDLIKLSAMAALGEIRHERAVQSLTDTMAYYKRAPLGLAALDALARIAHPSSLTLFSGLLEANDEQGRRAAVEGIARSGDKNAGANLLVRTARERSPLVLQAIAFARAKQGDYTQIAQVVQGLRADATSAAAFGYLVELGAPIAPSLGGAASYKEPQVRAGVAEVLGIIGSQASLPTLNSLAQDKDARVAAAAVRSQRRLVLRMPAQPRLP